MRPLSKIQNIIFLVGGLLMVIGAGSSLLAWRFAPYAFAVGAVCFAAMQMQQRYEGTNFTIRRLRRMMLISDVLFLVSALLMFASQGNIFGINHITYLQYIYNKWVITLLIAAILQLYSSHRIGQELEKEAKKL
ncbi:MAG: hypothetical protein J6W43_02055 [Prevotella sp.]|jgi:hypothetical protein|nr:hypothetical protein [Prevotella sp.]